ncbi:hypothetical protein [Pseudomonas sp. St316]|uniref:hypothetical protein n=1 Tax=Pseudomonas sp. St316 TaxID=2678257 RepID=UPI001BB35885|nr:hypothetical protein [Pseudomonas sp. St316]BBP59831.1 hypothetical protein PHLH4_34210 [Pseudomonas sp. St316]
MREMTVKEKDELERRKIGFDTFRKERMPILHNFAEILGYESPHEILIVPEKFLPYISKYMELQDVSDENRSWLLTRIGYFVGELLASKFDGCWIVDEEIDSSTFSKYVIGDFGGGGSEKVVDPFFLAQTYVDTLPPRSLIEHVDAVIRLF